MNKIRHNHSFVGSGANAVTKTIVEETIVKPDGSKVTRRSETTTSGGDSGGATGGFDGFKVGGSCILGFFCACFMCILVYVRICVCHL